MNISQKKLSHVWLISPWLPKPVLRARLKHVLKSIKKEDAALKREGLENLQEEQLKAVSKHWKTHVVLAKFHEIVHLKIHSLVPANATHIAVLAVKRFFLHVCMQSFSVQNYGYLKIQKKTDIGPVFHKRPYYA